MKNARMGNKESNLSQKKNDHTVEVLYQKMGDRWFAFSLINDEVFVGSISQSEIDVQNKELNKSGGKKIAGNS